MKTFNNFKQQYIDFYREGGLPLFRDGKPNRGSTSRCAFWDGFNGLPNRLYPGVAAEAWAAGRECANSD